MTAKQKSSNSTQAAAAEHLILQLISHWVIGNQRGTRKARLSYFLLITDFEHKVNDLVASKPGFLNILWASSLRTTFLAAFPAAKGEQPFEAVGRQTGPSERLD